MPKNPIKIAPKQNGGDYITWTNATEKRQAFQNVTVDNGKILQRTTASSRYLTKDVDTNINVRPGFGRDNYEHFREKEKLPGKPKEVMAFCNTAYKHVGVIRNVIDLMGDFASQGMKIVHPNSKIEKFYRDWLEKVGEAQIAERFLNYLYRLGTVPVRRMTAKLKQSDVERIQRAFAADIELQKGPTPERREIPWRYVFLNPMTIEPMSPELGSFVGKTQYGLRLTDHIIKKIINPSNTDKELIASLPAEIIAAARNGTRLLKLDENKNFIYFYKKDDWEDYGSPMISPLMDDIMMLEKLRLADAAACDGVISQVRLWTVGSLEHKILPTRAAIDKISDILTNNVGGGSIDLIFGPEVSFTESNTAVHNFLGEEKYKPTLNNIYAGLGIPPTLTGSATASGFTNNYISLKTLIERLEYGRNVFIQFMQQEIEFVRAAMGFRFPAKIVFDRMTLSDEAAEKALLLQLVDRDIVSFETVLERFHELPELERARIAREYKMRDSDKIPPKRSAFSNPEDDFMKLFIQSGVVSPSEAGIELLEPKSGEKKTIDYDIEMNKAKIAAKPKGVPGSGRPTGSGDKSKRKTKTVKPRTSAKTVSVISSWAKGVYNLITDTVLPVYLEQNKKTSARALTEEQFQILEGIKFNVLCGITPLSNVTDNTILEVLASNTVASKYVNEVYNNLVDKFIKQVRPELTVEDHRNLRICAYSVAALESLNKETNNG